MVTLLRFYLIDRLSLWVRNWQLFARFIDAQKLAQKAIREGSLTPEEQAQAQARLQGLPEAMKQWMDEKHFANQWHLIQKGFRLGLPLPASPSQEQFGENLEINRDSGVVLFKREYMDQVKDRVRKETEYRRTAILGWLAPLSGVIGTLIGTALGYWLGS